MATGDSGKFAPVATTTGKKLEVPFAIPADKLAITQIFQAVYLDANTHVSQWSPNIVVAVGKQNEPDMAQPMVN
jgi:hypothetical protein